MLDILITSVKIRHLRRAVKGGKKPAPYNGYKEGPAIHNYYDYMTIDTPRGVYGIVAQTQTGKMSGQYLRINCATKIIRTYFCRKVTPFLRNAQIFKELSMFVACRVIRKTAVIFYLFFQG